MYLFTILSLLCAIIHCFNDSQRGTVKLFDFGFCRALPEDKKKKRGSGNTNSNSTNPTDAVYRLTARMGTWRYMAPEVARGDPYNLKCDVYSLALVFWEMLVGTKPYANLANGSDELRATVTGGKGPSVDRLEPSWQEIVQHAGHATVSQRWTMAQVYEALQQHQAKLQSAAAAANTSPFSALLPRRQ